MVGSKEGLRQEGFRVRGRVQGVGFRWWTRRKGSELGLRGTVENCSDGSVEAHAAGDEPTLDAFVADLWRGPLGARVDSVERFESNRSLPSEFEISHGAR